MEMFNDLLGNNARETIKELTASASHSWTAKQASAPSLESHGWLHLTITSASTKPTEEPTRRRDELFVFVRSLRKLGIGLLSINAAEEQAMLLDETDQSNCRFFTDLYHLEEAADATKKVHRCAILDVNALCLYTGVVDNDNNSGDMGLIVAGSTRKRCVSEDYGMSTKDEACVCCADLPAGIHFHSAGL
jgi:hypothetical protein